MWGSHGSSPILSHPWLGLEGAHAAPARRWAADMNRMGDCWTLQNCASNNGSPKGAIWDSRTWSCLLGQGLLLLPQTPVTAPQGR